MDKKLRILILEDRKEDAKIVERELPSQQADQALRDALGEKEALIEEILRLNRLYDVLSQVNQSVLRVRSKEELFSAVCRNMVERGAINLAWIGLVNPQTCRIDPAARYGDGSEMLDRVRCYADLRPEGRGNTGRAIREGVHFICNECGSGTCSYPHEQQPARFGFRSCGSFPLRFQERVYGVLNLCVAEPGFFREREIELLKEVAMDISYALDRLEGEFQREQLSEKFRRQSMFLRTLQDAMPYPVFYKDTHLRYLGCNKAFEQFVGIRRDEIIGKATEDVWPLDLAGLYLQDDREVLAGRGNHMYETLIEDANGERYNILVHKALFRNQDGSVAGIIGAFVDITERKRAEEERIRVEAQLRQAQKMDALGTLAGGIAHDFNNILGIILGYAEMAGMEAREGSELHDELQQITGATMRAKDLVQQILAFSRQGEHKKQAVQVGTLVKEALKMLRASLPSSIEIKSDIADKAVVMADPTQLHQILVNLCTNAGHAMRDCGGTLQVDLGETRLAADGASALELAPGPYVQLTVKDTGHGIDPAIIYRIFDPFFTTKAKGVGTGLGLSMVHGIVKRYGGAIQVESISGRGTTFRVFLPAAGKAPLQEEPESGSLPGGRERILVVDDEPALALLLKRRLEHLGYEADYRTSGLDALEAFRNRAKEKPYDLLISDITMPHLTGADLARAILQTHPGFPIVLCTGFSETIDAEIAKSLGIQGYLMKPVVLKELALTIREILDGKK